MVEYMEDLESTEDALTNPAALLAAIGELLWRGTPWEHVFHDARWTYRTLYITYTHDRLGTPDHVEGVSFSRDEAEALAKRIAQHIAGGNPLQQQFLKCKVTEWPLGSLAVREARDGFHHAVLRHIVTQIKTALRESDRMPDDAIEVAIGASHHTAAAPGFIDASGRRIVLWEDSCEPIGAHDTIDFTVLDDRRCGLMDARGAILVQAEFSRLGTLCDGLAAAWREGGAGYIDAEGNVAVPFRFEDVADCRQDLLLVKSGGMWGAIDRAGREIIPPRFEALAHDVGNEALRAVREGKHGYLSLRGELLFGYCEQALDLVEHSFSGERSVYIARDASVGEMQYVLVDALGRRIGMKGFAGLRYGPQGESLMCALQCEGQRRRFGYVDLHGDTVIPFQFAEAGSFSEGLAAAATDTAEGFRFGYIDNQGHWVIAPRFAEAEGFHQGLAAVAVECGTPWRWPHPAWRVARLAKRQSPALRYGYIDRSGRFVAAPRYLEARPFAEGFAPVRHEQGWGYVDSAGRLAIPGPYHEAGPFKQGVARVARRYDGPLRYGLIDMGGRELIPLRFERLSYPQRGLISACDEFGLWGGFTLFGNIVAPFIYRDAHDLLTALTARGPAPQSTDI